MKEETTTRAVNELFNYGVLGIFCLFLIGLSLIVWVYAQKREKYFWEYHKIRDEQFLKQSDEFNKTIKENAVNQAAQTEVLRGLKDIIQSRKN